MSLSCNSKMNPWKSRRRVFGIFPARLPIKQRTHCKAKVKCNSHFANICGDFTQSVHLEGGCSVCVRLFAVVHSLHFHSLVCPSWCLAWQIYSSTKSLFRNMLIFRFSALPSWARPIGPWLQGTWLSSVTLNNPWSDMCLMYVGTLQKLHILTCVSKNLGTSLDSWYCNSRTRLTSYLDVFFLNLY